MFPQKLASYQSRYQKSDRNKKKSPRLFKIGYFDEFPVQNDHFESLFWVEMS